MKRTVNQFSRSVRVASLAMFCVLAVSASASAQSRRTVEGFGKNLVDIKLGEVTLEAIDFRHQTARLNVGMDISTPIGARLKDFDYRLRLFEQELIEGQHDGTLKLGGQRGSRLNLPVVVNLRSIPGVVWQAFSNRGQVRYDLDAGFTLPLFVFEQRFDRSFSGEVPLKSVVDAASILRARRISDGGDSNRWGDILPRIW
ncbi:MAG: LEA type 2 family protein [Pyrinomonadaceae bacterium]|nr:LEA type 2 family protein [Pyrinomonadaceae bacterium]